MKTIVWCSLALSFLSCARVSSFPGASSSVAAIEPDDDESLRAVIESPEDARSDFESMERLRENPVDPAHATLDALLAIPGFPPALAERVCAETRFGNNRGRWIDRLAPPERAALYRFRDVLVLPDLQPIRMNLQATAAGVASVASRHGDCRVSLSSPALRALVRWRGSDEGQGAACYVSGTALSGALRLHAGNLTPDFALGLICGGTRGAVSSSAAYPLSAPRGVAGSASFSTAVLRGGAAEVWCRRAHAIVFGGRRAAWDGERFEAGETPLWGTRLALRLGGAEVGASWARGLSGPETAHGAVDGRLRRRGADLAAEVAFGSEGPGYAAAISGASPRMRGSLAVHAIPPGIGGAFTSVNGRSLGASTSESGLAAVLEREAPGRIVIRCSLDRYARGEGFETRSRRALIVDAERRWRGGSAGLAWVSAAEERGRAAPVPGPDRRSSSESQSVGAVVSLRFQRCAALKLAAKHVRRNAETGVLFSPGFTLSLFHGGVQLATSLAVYRGLSGSPPCWFYEPSLQGDFPMAVASTDVARHVSLISFRNNWLKVSSKVEQDVGGRPNVSFQASISR